MSFSGKINAGLIWIESALDSIDPRIFVLALILIMIGSCTKCEFEFRIGSTSTEASRTK